MSATQYYGIHATDSCGIQRRSAVASVPSAGVLAAATSAGTALSIAAVAVIASAVLLPWRPAGTRPDDTQCNVPRLTAGSSPRYGLRPTPLRNS
jgi:hypothetical protein